MPNYFDTFLKQTKNAGNLYMKASLWGKILVITICILLVLFLFRGIHFTTKEGFEQTEKFLFKNGTDIYDKFYIDVYDYLVFNNIKNEYEVGEIINKTIPSSESRILDVGCGTGHHVGGLASHNLNVIGIDISPAMISQAKKNYPKGNFRVADAMNPSEFPNNSLTHILCMYFTLYYFEDKQQFFQNAYDWLMPGGYLILHLVDRDKFSPILPLENPKGGFLTQSAPNVTKTKINNVDYTATFHLDKQTSIARFVEKFENKADNKIRRNEHVMYMPTIKEIADDVQETGFSLGGIIDLMNCQYEYQYLYMFIKPN
jgi:ubiquinone/menaquinone biosynthesis C-methylase UbiE